VRFGSPRIVWPGLQVRTQADVFPSSTEPRARFLFTIGYTFL
jgi:hypothetical protein